MKMAFIDLTYTEMVGNDLKRLEMTTELSQVEKKFENVPG